MRNIKLRRTRVLVSAAALILLAVVFAKTSAKDSSSEILGSFLRYAAPTVSAHGEPPLLAVETWTGGANDNDWSSGSNWEGLGGAGADESGSAGSDLAGPD